MSARLRLFVPLALLAVLAFVAQLAAPGAGASSNVNQVVGADFAGVNYVGAGTPAVPGKTIRLWDDGTTWCDLEPHPGDFQTGGLEALVNHLRNDLHYTQIILVLGMTPQWASTATSPIGQGPNYICSGQAGYTTTVPTEDAWWGYVTHLATEFAGRITAYEVWNEPSSTTYWNGTVQQMSRLTSLAYWAIKPIDPAAQVLSGSLTRYSPNDWNHLYVQQLGWDGWQVDGIAFHSYSQLRCPARSPQTCTASEMAAMLQDHIDQVQTVNSYIAQMQPPRPISVWETEVNHNDAGASWVTLSQGAQVQVVARTFMDDLDLGVNHEVWYAFDRDLGGVRMGDSGAAYLTLRTMQSWVTGHVFTGCWHTTYSGVAVTRCWDDGREIDWAAKNNVTIPGLNGLRCTLPDGTCGYATNVSLTQTPQLIIYQ